MGMFCGSQNGRKDSFVGSIREEPVCRRWSNQFEDNGDASQPASVSCDRHYDVRDQYYKTILPCQTEMYYLKYG